MKCQIITGVAASAVLAVPLMAQEAPTPANPVTQSFQAWQAEHGDNWMLRTAPETGAARFLYGGSVAAQTAPISGAEYEMLARDHMSESFAMFGVADATLRLQDIKSLEMSHIGSTDKTAVLFDHFVNDIPVLNGYTSVIFSEGGVLVAIDSTGLPGVENLSTIPALDPFTATAAAAEGYIELENREPVDIHDAELVILKQRVGKAFQGRLAWAIEMHTPVAEGMPSGRRMYVAADNASAEVIGNDQLVHTQGISGTVNSWITPGVRPDVSNNPEILEAMKFMNVQVGGTQVQTNEFGDFNSPGSTGTQNVTVTYNGPFVNVNNQSGGDYSLTQSATAGTPITMEMNPGKTALVTAEANAYHHVVEFRQWVRATDPSDAKMDFQILANVNLNSNCNAFFNGSSINMYTSGGGCVNTSYSTVVSHEEGHWANVIYGTGNGPDGMGEGGADIWAMFINDTAIVGEEFFGQGGGFIRTGNNTRQFCGDTNPGCYGQVHADGEVIMGAFWKWRSNLVATHGTSGKDIADTLMLGWFNVYNDTGIRSIIEEHILVLDDDDNNLANGTPNFADIDNGFRAQGFPGFSLPIMDIQHTALQNTTNEVGPYTATADIQSLISGGSIVSARVKYRVDGGSEQTVNMTNTGGTNWSGDIPGQTAPARVTYFIEGTDNFNNTRTNPESGDIGFWVGTVKQLVFSDFESGTQGWTHGQIQTQDDWQLGAPQGKVQDPASAFSGNAVWANDLGNTGWNGEYANNVSNWLQSPNFDFSGETNVQLSFKRWLNVEESQYDQAILKVNGTEIWRNPFSGNFLESSWNTADYDVSAIADNNPSVNFRFEMISDGGLVFGGWNIDDFEVISVTGGGGPIVDTINLTGNTTAFVNGTATYNFDNGPANGPWTGYWSKRMNGTTINGQPFDIGPGVKVLATGTLDGSGAGTWTSGPIPSKAAGATIFIEWRGDDPNTLETFDSNPITLQIF